VRRLWPPDKYYDPRIHLGVVLFCARRELLAGQREVRDAEPDAPEAEQVEEKVYE
jgi:hypothetical protein